MAETAVGHFAGIGVSIVSGQNLNVPLSLKANSAQQAFGIFGHGICISGGQGSVSAQAKNRRFVKFYVLKRDIFPTDGIFWRFRTSAADNKLSGHDFFLVVFGQFYHKLQ